MQQYEENRKTKLSENDEFIIMKCQHSKKKDGCNFHHLKVLMKIY